MPKLDNIDIPVAVVRSMVPVPENLTEAISENGVKRSQISVPARDGSTIKALLYQPQEPPTQGSPLIVFYHGGGWCLGSPLSEDKNWYGLKRERNIVKSKIATDHLFYLAKMQLSSMVLCAST